MRVVITGASTGMGLATSRKFLDEGHEVFGIDLIVPPLSQRQNNNYRYFITDVSEFDSLPNISHVDILVNNAGVQGSGKDIDINLKGLINITRKYAINNPDIKSVLNQASAAAHSGADYDEYVASKGGVISYTKWTAKEIAKYGATCNSLSFGGVQSEINSPVMNNPILWNKVMALTPLRRWTTVEEAAEWIYFMTVINKSCSGSDIIIDNLESLNGTFVWDN